MVNNNYPESLQAIQKFSETYAKRTGTFFCSDLSITAVVIEGLARHKDEYGAHYALAVTMMTKLLKYPLHIGIVHASQCEKEKNAIVCYFLQKIMNFRVIYRK